MANELGTTNGRTATVYFGKLPWHRLGTRLDGPATAGEAIGGAGRNYTLGLCPLPIIFGKPVDGRKARSLRPPA